MEFNLDLLAPMNYCKNGNMIARSQPPTYRFSLQVFVWMLLLVSVPFLNAYCKCKFMTILSFKVDNANTNGVEISTCSNSQSQIFALTADVPFQIVIAPGPTAAGSFPISFFSHFFVY